VRRAWETTWRLLPTARCPVLLDVPDSDRFGCSHGYRAVSSARALVNGATDRPGVLLFRVSFANRAVHVAGIALAGAAIIAGAVLIGVKIDPAGDWSPDASGRAAGGSVGARSVPSDSTAPPQVGATPAVESSRGVYDDPGERVLLT
jgi:hypothetical protein